MRVLLLSRYGYLGASSRVRSFQYLPYLEAHDIHVTVAPLLEDNYLKNLYTGKGMDFRSTFRAYFRRVYCLLKSCRFDFLWIEKELFPWLPAWGELMLINLKIPYIVDYDDALFHRYDLHSKGIIRALLSNKIDMVMRRSTLVTVGNDYLRARAIRAGAKWVEYLPTVVDLDRYSSITKAHDTVFTIGWIGTPVTVKFLHMAYPALTEISKNNNVRLVLIGSGKVEFDGLPVVVHDWSSETEVTAIQSFDVGIMPLPDSQWERGKCGYKLIQYMACGKPVIASPVGVNQQIVENGVNGFLAKSTEEWGHALRVLRDDNRLRERMGSTGRKKVESEYCLQVTAPRLATMFRNLEKRTRIK